MKFIEENPGCTYTQIINHMDPHSGEKYATTNTTNKILRQLEKSKKVFYRVEGGDRAHHYYINPRNKYIMISSQLSKTRTMIEQMQKERMKMTDIESKLTQVTGGPGTDYERKVLMKIRDYEQKYYFQFKPLVDIILYELMINTAKTIPIEGDCHKLYAKIIGLMTKLGLLFYQPNNESIFMVDLYLKTLSNMRSKGRDDIVDMHTIDNFIETIEGINPKTLAVRLKEMLENDLIERKVYPGIPVRVEYSVTEKGKSVLPILEQMLAFSMKYAPKVVFADGKPRSFKDILGRHTERMP